MAENGIANRGRIVLAYTGGSVDLPIKSVRGLDEPDRFGMWPPTIVTYSDGEKKSQFQGFRRLPIINVGVVESRDDRLNILKWIMDNDRLVHYCTDDMYYADNLSFVPSNPDEFENIWVQEVSALKKYIFDLEECSIRTEWPTEV